MADEIQKGLEGVLIGETELSYIDGDAGELAYRGIDIGDLAAEASFEEVLFLLWHGGLPTRSELTEFEERLADERTLDQRVIEVLETLAEADEHPMAAIRTAVSSLSAFDPEPDADPYDLEATLRKGRRITAKLPTALAAYDRLRQGESPVEPTTDRGIPADFLAMLTGEAPDDLAAETFEQVLILHMDHGINASTFASLVIAGTMADMHCGVTGGIGALSGPLHGGASQQVMEVLDEIDRSQLDPREWIERAFDEDRRIPGFGHRVYEVKDPRAIILEDKARELVAASGRSKWYDYATVVEDYLVEAGLPEHGIATNVDFYTGTIYDQLGIALDMYTAIFAMSRVSGWIAHILEYQQDNRLIRPRARYVGPTDRSFVTIGDR
jgi:citrate synthase